jgi:hypothetical protein
MTAREVKPGISTVGRPPEVHSVTYALSAMRTMDQASTRKKE